MKTKIYILTPKSPPLKLEGKSKSIFLAGTIDNGDSEDWQSKFIDKILEKEHARSEQLVIFNPRRNNWNNNATEQEQHAQIDWEFKALHKADYIIMNLLPDSKSPISLLELGLFADKKKLIIICPKEFYRYYNVYYIAKAYNLPIFESIEQVYEFI
jgi:hypothetical protein